MRADRQTRADITDAGHLAIEKRDQRAGNVLHMNEIARPIADRARRRKALQESRDYRGYQPRMRLIGSVREK